MRGVFDVRECRFSWSARGVRMLKRMCSHDSERKCVKWRVAPGNRAVEVRTPLQNVHVGSGDPLGWVTWDGMRPLLLGRHVCGAKGLYPGGAGMVLVEVLAWRRRLTWWPGGSWRFLVVPAAPRGRRHLPNRCHPPFTWHLGRPFPVFTNWEIMKKSIGVLG